jgi:hypothetical protein
MLRLGWSKTFYLGQVLKFLIKSRFKLKLRRGHHFPMAPFFSLNPKPYLSLMNKKGWPLSSSFCIILFNMLQLFHFALLLHNVLCLFALFHALLLCFVTRYFPLPYCFISHHTLMFPFPPYCFTLPCYFTLPCCFVLHHTLLLPFTPCYFTSPYCFLPHCATSSLALLLPSLSYCFMFLRYLLPFPPYWSFVFLLHFMPRLWYLPYVSWYSPPPPPTFFNYRWRSLEYL